MISRGVRNCNPGNIRISSIKWQNKVTPSVDPDFETFTAPEWGIRALVKILLSDADKGINTVHAIISRYAPNSENNTKAYEDAVCSHINVKSDQILDLDDYDTVYALVGAIILHENGSVPYSQQVMDKGINLAGIHNAPKPTAMQRPETKCAASIGAATTLAVVGNTVNAINPAIPLVQTMISASPWIAGAIAIAVIGYLAYIVYRKHVTGDY